MSRGKKKALVMKQLLASVETKIGEIPKSERRAFYFEVCRKPLNKIPRYMRSIGKRGALVTNTLKKAA